MTTTLEASKAGPQHPLPTTEAESLVYFNGKFLPASKAVMPLDDRGFLFGDGLFETVRVRNGRPFRFLQHLERLEHSADFARIKLPQTIQEIQKIGVELLKKNHQSECVLRVMITRGSGSLDYAPESTAKPTLVISQYPLPTTCIDTALEWRMVTSPHQLAPNDVIAGFKTSHKLLNVLARQDAVSRGADEALLTSTTGEILSAAGGNLFWVFQNRIYTVPAGRGVLPGITRAIVMGICDSIGLENTERSIKLLQLLKSEGIFICQSVYGIVPIVELDGQPIPQSPLVDQIASAYNQLLLAETK